MGFSLKRFVSKVAAVAPVAAAVLPLPPAVKSAITTLSTVAGGRTGAPVAPISAAVMPFRGGFLEANGGGVTPVGGTTGRLVVAGATRVATIMAKIAAHLGRRVAKWRVIELIRRWGPFAAAGALGIAAEEAIELWLSAGGARRRRARGVSAADIRRTTRTLSTLDRMGDRVRKFCRPSAFGPRRAPARRTGKR